ncbi:alpha-galactosidase [Hymenobacter volaticus]|uniref:Alpha-galactosidase n=1 Tax=Hymenobacter volaticus TaxID=2932254 RepID=A0ABY4G286_9BACT|nr:alpha-galactosidase [Hymenobacter volaticus]UOQ64977.1 alpha-galactosidase [Hymenobacter volaticus]
MRKLLLCVLFLPLGLTKVAAQAASAPIVIETSHTSLVFAVGDNKKLYQTYVGARLANQQDYKSLPNNHEAYAPAGTDNLFEPAIRVVHPDGNPSLSLAFVGVEANKVGDNVTTTIRLKDPQYPVEVALHFTAYFKEDVIKTWTEIRHQEKRPVQLTNYASAMLHFDAGNYWLTQFHGDWAEEVGMQESQLTSGVKVIDSKLGTRANQFQTPTFFLALNKPADEVTGELIAGTLSWTGNFRFAFELDQQNALRISAGINPYASEYMLPAGQPFVTPEFVFTYTNQGKGQASRNLHRWARQYSVLDGTQPRLTLLNNWEATFFDFNEAKLDNLIGGARKLGVDLFLLDDGWFGNKYPRNDDQAGLGDWQANKTKLPSGVGHLVQTAQKENVKFGIWLEPEMVNPKSELYEKHPDWILKLPNRPEHLSRNQLVLDLTNPKVQDFVFNVVDEELSKGVAYVKWDCNRMMTNTYSPYLGKNQSHVFVDYVRGLYKVLDRVRQKYPHVPMMLCSGGGGRTDYGGLRYFTEFWASDNTDAFERIFIQWSYSNFFPSLTVSNHVTNWNRQQSIKFRTDVAMMGKLGYDIEVDKLQPEELTFSQQAIKEYKRLSPVIWQGDLFRLRSPYESNQAALMYVDPAQQQAVLFAYNLHTRYNEVVLPLKLQGLDPARRYRVTEINLMPGSKSPLAANSQTYSGDYLMKAGILVSPGNAPALTSHVLELRAE